jgi:hypothetical protein
VFAHVWMPSLGGATGWLDSEPLGPAELRGHVVVVDFWTLTCINWLRQEPYVRAWSQAYRNVGARDRPPVTVDNDYAISERAIRRLLGVERELVGVEGPAC